MNAPLPAGAPAAPLAIATPSEAAETITHLTAVMDALLDVLERETALVRAGRLSEVARLAPTKADLARFYHGATQRLQASRAYLREAMPAEIEALRLRHDNFRALLQINLTVLATAHAVSQGIVRGVAEAISQQSSPQAYGASGRQTAAHPRHAPPIAVSRVL